MAKGTMYCGNGKMYRDKFGNDNFLLKLTVKDVELLKLALDNNQKQGGNNVSIGISKRQTPSKFGDNYYGFIFPYKKFTSPASPTKEGKDYDTGCNPPPAPASEHRYSDADLPPREHPREPRQTNPTRLEIPDIPDINF